LGGGAQAGHADADRAVLADDGDGLVDAGPVSRGEAGDVAFDAADELPDDGDLLVGGGCLVACPGVDAGDGGEPFAGAEQCCPSLKCPMKAAFRAPMWGCLKAPQPGWLRGLGGGGAAGCG
jgi:hypothetical protein